MTEIAYIRGIGNVPPPEFSRTATPAPAYDPQQMTAGEFRAALLADQLNILGSYYDIPAEKAASKRILDALAIGLHNTAGNIDTGNATINRAMRKYKNLSRPAAKFLARKSIVTRLPDALLAGLAGQASIGEIQFPDCAQYLPEYDPYDNQTLVRYGDADAYQKCQRQVEYIGYYNRNLTKASHHILYEFTAGTGNPGSVATKRVLHRNAVSKFAELGWIDRENMRAWVRNSILRNNVDYQIDPLQPEATYQALRDASQQGIGAGGAFLILLPKLLSAFAGAVSATMALVAALKSNDRLLLQNATQGIGTATWGPEQEDFQGAGTGTPGQTPAFNNELIIPLAAGAAALLLLR
ncbi:MAG: hypothetical protein KF852_04220 [Saprospiraceae bacterium]|nr:hypothetical protein [Saprospiraceae bacterium]